MKNKAKAIVKFLFVWLLAAVMLSGCNNEQDKKPTGTDAANESGNDRLPDDMTQDEYISYLKELPAPDGNVLLFYSWHYQNASIQDAFNELLEKNGFEFRVEFRESPSLPAEQHVPMWDKIQAEGIPVDILSVGIGLRQMAESGMVADMTEYLASPEGAGLKGNLPDAFWDVTEINGGHYGVGNMEVPGPGGWAVNKALMEKYHITPGDMAKPLWELEDIIKTVYEGEKETGGFAACAFDPYNFIYFVPFTKISGSVGVFHDDETVTAVNFYESDYVKKLAETLERFREAGYYMEYDGRKNFFMEFDRNGFPMFDENDVSWEGVEVVRVPYYETALDSVYYPSVCAIDARSDKKEWAMELLSFTYQNAEAANLLRFGMENEDYMLENGFAVPVTEGQGVPEYYHSPLANQFIAAPVGGTDPSDHEKAYAGLLDSFERLPINGFSFDSSPVQKQVAAVEEICNSIDYLNAMFYNSDGKKAILDGEYETVDDVIDAYNAMLKKAGIDDVIAEMNRQIKEYLSL